MEPQSPTLTSPPEDVGREHLLAAAQTAQIRPALGFLDAGEDVLLAGDDGEVPVDLGGDSGEEELDVAGVGHQHRPRPHDPRAADEYRPTGVNAANIVRVVPDGLHAVEVGDLEGLVELLVGGGDGLDVSRRGHGAPPVRAATTAAATRTASALARASCTRTPHAPAAAARAETAAVASSRSTTGRGSSPSVSSVPRNDLRLAPTSTGRPRESSVSRWASSAQLCSAVLAKPIPGSTMICSIDTPAPTTASMRAASSSCTSRTTSS